MKVPCIASFVSLTLALATPSVGLAQPPTAVQDGPRPVRLELDASAVGDRALGLEDLLREELAPVFGANQAQLVDMSRSEVPHLRVRIGGKFKDIELFKYELHFELVEGDNVTKLIDPVVCEKCYDDVIVSTVGAQVPTLLEAVDARTAAVDPGDGDPGDGDSGDGDSTPSRKPIGPIGGVGIGVAAAGLGITIAGAVQWSRGRVPDDDLTRRTSEGRDYTGQGQLLVGLGAGALVVGVVMLAVDLSVLAKRRNGAARAQLLPTIGPERAGIVVQGRF
jgi:hypothetical protein